MEREALKALIDKALARSKAWNRNEAGSPKGIDPKGVFVPLENGAGASRSSLAKSVEEEAMRCLGCVRRRGSGGAYWTAVCAETGRRIGLKSRCDRGLPALRPLPGAVTEAAPPFADA
ncbi:MAG: hypothetical protein IKX79_00165 [Desulfovibrionaceae bacterium]|nr:hypothetical protein [Desulfovibrionaceae bacterium]